MVRIVCPQSPAVTAQHKARPPAALSGEPIMVRIVTPQSVLRTASSPTGEPIAVRIVCPQSSLRLPVPLLGEPMAVKNVQPVPQPSSVPAFPLMPRIMPERSGTWSRLWQAASPSPCRSGKRTCLACAGIWNGSQSMQTRNRNGRHCMAAFRPCRRCCAHCRKQNEPRETA